MICQICCWSGVVQTADAGSEPGSAGAGEDPRLFPQPGGGGPAPPDGRGDEAGVDREASRHQAGIRLQSVQVKQGAWNILSSED